MVCLSPLDEHRPQTKTKAERNTHPRTSAMIWVTSGNYKGGEVKLGRRTSYQKPYHDDITCFC